MKPTEQLQFKKQVNECFDILSKETKTLDERVRKNEWEIELIDDRLNKYLTLTHKRYVKLKWMILVLAFLLLLSIIL